MFGKLLEPEIKELIEARDFASLREIFKEWSPADLAELLTDLPDDEQVILFRVLPHDVATETFEHLGFDAQENLLRAMGQEEKVKLLNEMSADDRTALLEELPSSAVTHLLKLLSPEERHVAQSLLGYPEHSIGRLMTPDFIAIREDWTVKQVFDFIRENGRDSETLNVVYVVDEKGRLIDDIRIREFLLRPFESKVSEIRDRSFVTLKVTDSEKDAVDLFKKYDRTAMPVIDSEDLLVGIVTIDDVLDVVEEETTAEIQKIGGMEALDEPYTTISLWRMVKKRATWLVLLFLGEMLTATAMQSYEGVIEKAAVLSLFLPLIISSGGNSGSQATTLIIRAMAVGEVRMRDWWRVAVREMMAGASLGVILGVVGFSRISVWHFLNKVFPHFPLFTSYNPHWDLVAMTVGCALVGVVLWGSLMGAMLPFVLRRCGLDPATSSAPLVATLVDVTGLLIYFNIALVILRGTIL
jgi:magnesium transporter